MGSKSAKVLKLRHRHLRFTLKPPLACSQCGSLVWNQIDY